MMEVDCVTDLDKRAGWRMMKAEENRSPDSAESCGRQHVRSFGRRKAHAENGDCAVCGSGICGADLFYCGKEAYPAAPDILGAVDRGAVPSGL